MEAKSASDGASLRPEHLGAGTHKLPPRVISLWRDLTMLRRRGIHGPVAIVPLDLVIAAIRHGWLDPPLRVAFSPAQRIVMLHIRAEIGMVAPDIGAIPE